MRCSRGCLTPVRSGYLSSRATCQVGSLVASATGIVTTAPACDCAESREAGPVLKRPCMCYMAACDSACSKPSLDKPQITSTQITARMMPNVEIRHHEPMDCSSVPREMLKGSPSL